MPITSRYRFSSIEADAAGRRFRGPRLVFGFRELPDTALYIVSEGDSLRAIAAAAYAGHERPEQFYWVIADFQPEPIRDVTLPLEPGRKLYIPSGRALDEQILSNRRSALDADDDA